MRLDQAVAARFSISRRKAREEIAAGRVLVNQRRVAIASREVDDDDELTLVPDTTPKPRVLAMKDDWIAVDKPAGVPTQPTRDRTTLSLEELLRSEYKRIWLVHRLDTPASGVVVFARNAEAAARLSSFFASREVRKIYVARIDPPISERTFIHTAIEGKEAKTVVIPREDGLVEVEIETGRTHQIRKHLSSIGHPIVGDARYGSTTKAPRLMLHAWKLEHAELGTIEAPIPPEFL